MPISPAEKIYPGANAILQKMDKGGGGKPSKTIAKVINKVK